MRIDRAGFPFVGAAALPAVLLAVAGRWGWAGSLAGLALAFAGFFRDPERTVPQTAGAVVAPADGRILKAGVPDEGVSPPGRWHQVSIFLSPLDVHINRVPIGGRVLRIERRGGGFVPAYRREAASNAQTEIWLACGDETVVVRQVVGILARRIICRLREGQVVATGERLGLMAFGSRMDLFVPLKADLEVGVGQRVRAGETIVARLPQRGNHAA